MKEFRKSYANKQCNFYPEDLTSMFEVMRTVEIKMFQVKNPPPKRKEDDKVPSRAESFVQTGAKKDEDQR